MTRRETPATRESCNGTFLFVWVKGPGVRAELLVFLHRPDVVEGWREKKIIINPVSALLCSEGFKNKCVVASEVSACCWLHLATSWRCRSESEKNPSPGRRAARSTWRRRCCLRKITADEMEPLEHPSNRSIHSNAFILQIKG